MAYHSGGLPEKVMVQRLQNKVLTGIVNAPWGVRNSALHPYLDVEMVADVIQ